MNIFFLLLYLDDEAIDIATLTQNMDNEERQRELYRLQEYGSMIAANWDVLGKIYRETPAFNKDKVGLAKDSHITYDMLIKTLFKKIHELIPLIHFSDEVCEFKIMKKLKDSCSAVYDQALESRESPDDLPTFTEPKAEDKGQLVTVRVDENQLKNLMTNLQFTFQSSFTSGKRFD